MNLLDFATDLVDRAAQQTEPKQHADLFWMLICVAAAGLETVEGGVAATERLYRIADGAAGRLAKEKAP